MSVAGKMTLVTGLLLTVVFLATGLVNVALQRRATTAILHQNAVRLTETTLGALRDGMLANDTDRIRGTIATLSLEREIQRIRIIDPEGDVAYSTFAHEVGQGCGTERTVCASCHDDVSELTPIPTHEMVREHALDGLPVLSLSVPIVNDPSCFTAACHVHPAEESVLGVMSVDLSLASYRTMIRGSARELLLSSLVGMLLALVVTAMAARRIVSRPINELIEGTRQLARGDLSARVHANGSDEVGLLGSTFNQLAMELQQARHELLEWGRTLETRVERKTQELSQARDQMMQVDKMASLGKLAAVVAHEINNPLASVVTYAKLIARRIRTRELTDECKENLTYLDSIASEAGRCGEIVSRLLAFSRRDSGEYGPTDLNKVVEQSLFLVKHQLEIGAVEAHVDVDAALPEVEADANQLQQALLALLINATQAIESGGNVHLATRRVDGGVQIEVRDDGPGMPPEVAGHAFEPFYTTKEEGQGVGLGLSVVYGIVERHHGRIELETAPGKGCRFLITLPVRRPAEREAGS